MRVSPAGWAFDDEETVLAQAEASAAVTHNHPEGIKGAQATALAVFLARTGAAKEEIRARLTSSPATSATSTPSKSATTSPHFRPTLGDRHLDEVLL